MENFKLSSNHINIYRGRRTKASLKVCKSSPTMPPLPPTAPPTAPCPPAALSKCVGCPPLAVTAGGIMLSPLVAKPATPLAPPLNWWWWLLCRPPPWWCSGLGELHKEWMRRREKRLLALGGCCSLTHKSGLTDDWHVLIALAAFFRLNTLTNPHVVSSGVFCYAPNRPVRVCVFGSRIVWQRRWCVWDHHMILSKEKTKAYNYLKAKLICKNQSLTQQSRAPDIQIPFGQYPMRLR